MTTVGGSCSKCGALYCFPDGWPIVALPVPQPTCVCWNLPAVVTNTSTGQIRVDASPAPGEVRFAGPAIGDGSEYAQVLYWKERAEKAEAEWHAAVRDMRRAMDERNAARTELDNARAEIERLTTHAKCHCSGHMWWKEQAAKAKIEVERLKEALRNIAACDRNRECECVDLADAALETAPSFDGIPDAKITEAWKDAEAAVDRRHCAGCIGWHSGTTDCPCPCHGVPKVTCDKCHTLYRPGERHGCVGTP